ncbi:MAG: sugar phosphate isomerase/epimerase [Anaeroplasmataceae bacterium]|nr:sugar phosphate isomerase/epimerase [Anaeroplasmataceae bacterium]
MKIGVRVHDFGKSDPISLAKSAKQIGFDGVQLVLNKAVEGETGLPGTLSKDKAIAIHNAFNKEGIEIFMMGAYFNPVHSNKDLVKTNIAKFKEHLRFLNDFKGHFVGSETGSFNDDKWTYHPLNRTEDAYQEVKRIFKDLADYAKEVDANIALEGAFGHCMFEPKALKRLVDEIDNGHVFYIVDIYNYIAFCNYESYKDIFEECLKLFKNKIVIFHLKDFIVENESLKQCAIGKGLIDYPWLLNRIQKTNPNAYLIFEGSKPEDMQESFNFVKNILNEGV